MVEFQLGFANEGVVRELSARRKEPEWLLRDRLRALENFDTLPIEDSELFRKYTDVKSVSVADCVPLMASVTRPPDREDGGGELAGIYRQKGDSLEKLYLSPDLEADGVILDTFEGFTTKHPDLLRSLVVDRSVVPERDKFSQMSRALFMAGTVLHVPDGVAVPKPVMIRWSAGRENTALITRTLVSLGEDSHATIVEQLESDGEAGGKRQSLFGGSTEVLLGPASELRYHGVQNLGENTATFVNRHAGIGSNSSINWALGCVGGGLVKSRVDNMLNGRGASVREVEVLYGHKSQFFDLLSHTRHIAEDTVSDLLSKGVLQHQSKAHTKGLITIEKGGKGSDSYLGEFGMVLSRESRFLAIPSLEIENHAVRRAKHSASVAQVDEKQVFYLMSRGIPEKEARKMIVMGFLEPVMERIPLESVATHLRYLFEAKWEA